MMIDFLKEVGFFLCSTGLIYVVLFCLLLTLALSIHRILLRIIYHEFFYERRFKLKSKEVQK